MPIISFVSPKGGAGKSTAALLLATELAQQGLGVTVIDSDEEQWIWEWGQGGRVPKTMSIVAQPTEDTILDEIDKASAKSPFVIVDLEGTANMVTAYAVNRSDLVIIPAQPSTMDAKSAAKAIRLVKQQERGFGRTIPFAVLFTMTKAAIRTRMEKDLAGQMEQGGVPSFKTQLFERSAYRAIFQYSCPLEELPKTVYKVDDAIANARSYAGELLSMFKQQKAASAVASAEESNERVSA